MHDERGGGNISGLLESLLNRECACGQTRVDGSVLDLEVEKQTIVQEFLDVKRDLHAVDGTIIGESDFDWNVEELVIVGMGVKCERSR
jgi:hypothetical protein